VHRSIDAISAYTYTYVDKCQWPRHYSAQVRFTGIGAGVESRRKSVRGRYYNAQFPSRSLTFA